MGDAEVVDSLLRFFIQIEDREAFCATLYTCYSLVSPDVALELAWRNGMTDFAMPYLIQLLKDTTSTLKAIDERTKPEEKEVPAEEMDQMNGGYGDQMGGGMLMLGDGNVGMAMGMGMGGPAMIPTQQPTMGMAAMNNMQVSSILHLPTFVHLVAVSRAWRRFARASTPLVSVANGTLFSSLHSHSNSQTTRTIRH